MTEADDKISSMIVPKQPSPKLTPHMFTGGVLFIVGLFSMFALEIAAGADLSFQTNAPLWSRILPAVVLVYSYPALMDDAELERLRHWPYLMRYPLETAAGSLVLALAYVALTRHLGPRFYGILGGTVMGLVSYARVEVIRFRRGQAFDRSLSALSKYVQGKRWRSRNLQIPL